MQKIKYIFLLCSAFAISLNASERPRWITETPPGFVHDFYVGIGTSKTPIFHFHSWTLKNVWHVFCAFFPSRVFWRGVWRWVIKARRCQASFLPIPNETLGSKEQFWSSADFPSLLRRTGTTWKVSTRRSVNFKSLVL